MTDVHFLRRTLMKKACCTMLAITLLAVLPLLAGEQKLGKGVTIKKATPVKALLSEPEKYVGKEVMIEGEITKVCQMEGCWIMVKDASSSEPIMIKVDDGVIVFPKDGAGKKIVAQGKLEKVADEAQKEAGSSSAYRIKGIGAVLK
jgi:RecJ-like exonuclease